MTPLSLDAPLVSLLALSAADGRKLSQRDIGEARTPPVAQASVANAIETGPSIKLSTLAAYAHAAGYTLWMGASRPEQERSWFEIGSAVTATIEQAMELWDAAGIEMELAVEPAEGSGR